LSLQLSSSALKSRESRISDACFEAVGSFSWMIGGHGELVSSFKHSFELVRRKYGSGIQFILSVRKG
jgi:hypothetical protein